MTEKKRGGERQAGGCRAVQRRGNAGFTGEI